MAFISLGEIFDIIVMSLAVGFIFMNAFKRPKSDDPVEAWRQQRSWKDNFLYAIMLVAPALILHELGHKFVAMGYGLQATFEAAYGWLAAGVILKLISFPFLIIVPAYVSVIGEATVLQSTLIAFAGPGLNLLFFLIAYLILKTQKLSQKWMVFWQYTKMINLFLFIFNMLPIPAFDGSKVWSGLFELIF